MPHRRSRSPTSAAAPRSGTRLSASSLNGPRSNPFRTGSNQASHLSAVARVAAPGAVRAHAILTPVQPRNIGGNQLLYQPASAPSPISGFSSAVTPSASAGTLASALNMLGTTPRAGIQLVIELGNFAGYLARLQQRNARLRWNHPAHKRPSEVRSASVNPCGFRPIPKTNQRKSGKTVPAKSVTHP